MKKLVIAAVIVVALATVGGTESKADCICPVPAGYSYCLWDTRAQFPYLGKNCSDGNSGWSGWLPLGA